MAGNGVEVTLVSDNMQRLKQKIEEQIEAKKDLEKLSKQIEITITAEGLRIEVLEDKNGTFYQSGSASLSSSGQELVSLLAGELKTLPNELLIEGHTDATQYSSDASYSNWELSADRANAARRLLQQDGVRGNQVTQVRGYADQMLRVKGNPYDPSNRRISILVKNDNGVPARITGGKPVAGPAPAGQERSPGGGKGQPAPPAAAPVPATQPTTGPQGKPAAGAPAAKPGLVDRLKGMLPGSRK
jgi:chemotaxis protein MotB